MRVERGFSLIELLVTVAVAALLLAAGAPSFRQMIQNSRITSQANELLTAIHFARSEALKRARPVSICGSADGSACGGGWAGSWLVFVDGNLAGDEEAELDELLRVWPRSPADAPIAGTLPDFLRLLPAGSVDPALIAGQITFLVRTEDCRGNAARELVVSPTGRAAIRRVAC
jgi:type IV fimbrial biogenesis protein FimT